MGRRHVLFPAALGGLAGLVLALVAPAAAKPAVAVPTAEQRQMEEQLQALETLSAKGDRKGALAMTEQLLATQPDGSVGQALLMRVRTGLLVELGRDADVVSAVEAMLDRNIEVEPAELNEMADAAARTSQPFKAAKALQIYAERFPAKVREGGLSWDFVAAILNELRSADGEAANQAMSLALFDAGYAAGNDFGGVGFIERQAIDGLVAQGRIGEAKARLDRMVDVRNLAGMAVDRRYEALWPALESALGPGMAKGIARNLGWMQQAFDADHDSHLTRQSYVHELIWLGFPQKAVALSENLLTTPAEIAASGRYGWWLFVESSEALGAAGQPAKGLLRYRQLNAAIPAGSGVRVDTMISEAAFASRYGLSADALESVARARPLEDVSAYGEGLLQQAEACALHRLGRDTEAASVMAKIEAAPLANRGASLDAMLCLGHYEPAEKLVLAVLDDPVRRTDMLLRLQGIELQKHDNALAAPMAKLAARPAVAAAIDRYGRTLPTALRPNA